MIPLSQKEVPYRLRRRWAFGCAGFVFAFFLLLGRLWYLQILQGDEMWELSKSNRIRLHRMSATRGRVVDRYDRVLIDSRPSYNAVLVREDAEDLPTTLANLAEVLHQSPEEMAALLKQTRGRSPFAEIEVKQDLTWEEVVAIETRQLDLPGVSVKISPRRSYPYGSLLSHLLGYVGETNATDLERDPHYRMGDLIGKAGLEQSLETDLRGVNGGEQVEVDAVGRKLRVLREVPETPGSTIQLTIDVELQQAAAAALGDRDGSVVAVDPNTGEILAFVNYPSYNPNLFAHGVSNEEWQSLTTDEHRPLSNRALHGQYPPGSIFKIIVATAALEEGIVNPFTRINCPGGLQFGNHYFRCWNKHGHGAMNVHDALVHSCDVFFYQVAQRLGIETIARYARMFGFGVPSGLRIGHERTGTIPDTAWKKKHFNQPWYAGETLSVAIGQGYVTATPIQMANLAATTATGRRMRPHFVREVQAYDGTIGEPEAPEVLQELAVKPSTLNEVRNALHDVVNSKGGTGSKARLANIAVAGKTLTSQVVRLHKQGANPATLPWKHRDHAGFVAYAPAENPEIAVAVLVEHALGGGGAIAAPIAREVMSTFFELQEKRRNSQYAQNRSPADRTL